MFLLYSWTALVSFSSAQGHRAVMSLIAPTGGTQLSVTGSTDWSDLICLINGIPIPSVFYGLFLGWIREIYSMDSEKVKSFVLCHQYPAIKYIKSAFWISLLVVVLDFCERTLWNTITLFSSSHHKTACLRDKTSFACFAGRGAWAPTKVHAAKFFFSTLVSSSVSQIGQWCIISKFLRM